MCLIMNDSKYLPIQKSFLFMIFTKHQNVDVTFLLPIYLNSKIDIFKNNITTLREYL